MKALAALALLVLSVRGGDVININTPKEYIQFVNDLNSGKNTDATVYLQNDLDFTGLSDQFAVAGKGYGFMGIFDGQGHKFSHLTFQSSKYWNFGIFGISSGLIIRNLIVDATCSLVDNYTDTRKPSDPLIIHVGGIIGKCEASKKDSLIENTIFMGKLSFTNTLPKDIYVNMGGIVGEAGSYGNIATVKNCVNFGTITFSGRSDSTSIGGIAGELWVQYGLSKTTYLYNCLNYGLLIHSGTTADGLFIGGIVASTGYNDIVIDNVATMGHIMSNRQTGSRKDYIGALFGYLSDMVVTYSYWSADTVYDACGEKKSGAYLHECSNFSSTSFTLMKSVSAGSYVGTSLIGALNAVSDVCSSTRGYSKWILNKGYNGVKFVVNGESPFLTLSTQLILMPTLADGPEKKFVGWYTDSACTTKLTKFEVNAETYLYGKLL